MRRAGDQLRVTARLVTVVGREAVWSEVFDAPLERVFSIQDEIIGTVARS